MNDRNALVLESQEYRENDALVTYLTSNGLLHVLARGVQKMTAKNRRLTQPFSKVNITIHESKKGFPILMYGSPLFFYDCIQTDLLKQSVCFVLNEIIIKTHAKSPIDGDLEACWQAMQKQVQPYSYANIVLKDVMRQQGIQPYMKGCVHCGRTDKIEAISMKDGGLLCTHCNHSQYPKRTKAELIQMISLFRVQPEHYSTFVNMYAYSLDDFIYWAEWIAYYLNLSLKSLSFLKSIR